MKQKKPEQAYKPLILVAGIIALLALGVGVYSIFAMTNLESKIDAKITALDKKTDSGIYAATWKAEAALFDAGRTSYCLGYGLQTCSDKEIEKWNKENPEKKVPTLSPRDTMTIPGLRDEDK